MKRKVLFVMMLGFSLPVLSECYNSSTINDACRYPEGDAWCREHGAYPYAYLHSCDPLVGSSHEEENEPEQAYESDPVEDIKDYCSDHPFICAAGAIIGGTLAYKHVQKTRVREYSSINTSITKECNPFVGSTSDDGKSVSGGCGNGKSWSCRQKGDTEYLLCTGPKTIDNVPLSGAENMLRAMCCN